MPTKKPAPTPPARQATARTETKVEVRQRSASEGIQPAPTILREPAPVPVVAPAPVVLREPAPPKTVFVYVNGERRDVAADTLACSLGKNVRHTDVGQRRGAADELVQHSMKYLAG